MLFVEPLIILFWTCGDVCPGLLKIWIDPSISCLVACKLQIPHIHLWCDTC